MRQPFIAVAILLIAGVWTWQYWDYRVPAADGVENVANESTGALTWGGVVPPSADGGMAAEGIPAIDRPTFVSVAVADQYLREDGYGMDVEMFGTHRFYPFQILVWHGVVNDLFFQRPIVITFSPLCSAGAVYKRPAQDATSGFGVSGLLWNNHSLLVDRATDSVWSQMLGSAIDGARKGEGLARYPSRTMTWKVWKTAYPSGFVLGTGTGEDRDYTANPYGDYFFNTDILFPVEHLDARLPAKALITGRFENSRATAAPYDTDAAASLDTTAYWFCWAALYPQTELQK